jgi:methionine-rich copper-binding protein CopC
MRLAAALVAAAVLAVGAASAYGHTGVARLVPGSGSTSTKPVKVVGVRFEDGIVTGTLAIATSSGRAVPARETGVVTKGTYLRSVLRSALADGSYRATWRARFEDGHSRSGSWTFRVR